MRQFRVKVPASSANLGPGFDSLGLALCKYLTVILDLVETPGPPNLNIDLQGLAKIPLSENLIVQILQKNLDPKIFQRIARLQIQCDFPAKRGLGSSAAAIVAAYGLIQLLETQSMDRELLFQKAFGQEGHPDNVAPAIYGHLCIATAPEAGIIRQVRLADDLRIFLLVPDWETSTHQSRNALPKNTTLAMAVDNIRATAHFISCLITGDFQSIKPGLSDSLHETQRIAMVPGLAAARTFLLDSEQTFGVFLSGSGPTLAAFCNETIDIGGEGIRVLAREKISAKCHVLAVNYKGIEWECS